MEIILKVQNKSSFLDNEKEASVKKRLEHLDRIQFVIKRNDDATYFDFLVEEISYY